MVYKVTRNDLKGDYDWCSSAVEMDHKVLNKNSGPELLDFIQSFYAEKGWQTDSNVHAIEDYLQLSFLHNVHSKEKLLSYLRTEFS